MRTENAYISEVITINVELSSITFPNMFEMVAEREEVDIFLYLLAGWCYQNFTNIARLKRKIADPQAPDSSAASSSKRRRLSGYSKSSAVIYPADKCLFCNKQNLKVKGEKEPLAKVTPLLLLMATRM